MRFPYLVVLLLAVACGEEPGGPPEEQSGSDPVPATLDMMRVVKVSGDQSARVPDPAAPAPSTAASTMPQWTTQPLVARIEVVPPQAGGASFSVAADSMYVPPGTLVHWRVDPDCGELFGQTTATDDSAYTFNRWAPGTKAGTCTVQAGRLVSGEIVIDTTWALEVLPGPIEQVDMNSDHYLTSSLAPDDTFDIRTAVINGRDAYGNIVPRDSVIAWPDSAVQWAWSPRTGGHPYPSEPTGSGWLAPVPPLTDESRSYDGTHDLWLSVWIARDVNRIGIKVVP